MRYTVQYEQDGKQRSVEYSECKDAGMAFSWCQKEFPESKMLHATAHSGIGGYEARTEYEPPFQRDPVKPPRAFRAPRRNERDGIMPFYDEALSEKPWD